MIIFIDRNTIDIDKKGSIECSIEPFLFGDRLKSLTNSVEIIKSTQK